MRHRLRSGTALALAGIAEIRNRRKLLTGQPSVPADARAYIIHQLKHPDEVELLRRVYGPRFFLIGGHSPRAERVKTLINVLAAKANVSPDTLEIEQHARELIEIDQKEIDDLGQNTRDTYPKADFFVNLGISGEHELRRFLELLFGHPFRTPTAEEYAMNLASAASLRSSDAGRQVGAVIVDVRSEGSYIRNVDIVAVGMNEVPRGGGGFYWDSDSPDNRDQYLLKSGHDRAKELKTSVLRELLERIGAKGWLLPEIQAQAGTLAGELVGDLKRTQFMDIGEFGRQVHAEMAAIIDAARRGVAVDGHSMYVTTFPCHNCAKHIVAAGIRRVIYLEPYPKSRANSLHGEELVLESPDGKPQAGKVVFSAFSGVAPRQFRQLFSMAERGKDKGRSILEWEAARATLVIPYIPPNSSRAYIAAECDELNNLSESAYRWDRAALCPPEEKAESK